MQTWRQLLLAGFKSLWQQLLDAAIWFTSLFAFSSAVILGLCMWIVLILGLPALFSYGVYNGRNDTSAGSNSFTATCKYRNLLKSDAMSTTFDAREARDNSPALS
jgi:hypothetical protein